ncbi:hypothetical protein PhCBS80983_g04388 [Powellomyces hirtus]|uniref:DNA replication complex GINS protein SLD5 n=1 Tax=Powellomyces hirtus TaxID=109895 RepID=A0A507E0A0_9FUNG|nr:hypothetical protein PhCBS80983_g04388 [Powellomyces hirtus]
MLAGSLSPSPDDDDHMDTGPTIGTATDSTFTFSLNDDNDEDDTTYFNDDIRSLTQWWINERCAPELLMYQADLVESLMEMMEAQAGIIESKSSDTPDSAFLVVLYQQEMERIKFIIRSYLRTRLAKIQRHTLHILREAEYRSRLSIDEIMFAEKYQELLAHHFQKFALEELPDYLQRLDDTTENLTMVSRPDLEDAVFCRIKEQIGVFQLESSDEAIEMRPNNIYFLRYNAIRRLMEDGKVDLV